MKQRISLRVMLAVVAAVSTGMAWWANSVRRQRGAVAAVHQSGGQVAYAYQFVNGDTRIPNANGKPAGPEWVWRNLGEDACSKVLLVGFGAQTPSDDALKRLESFRQLRGLYIKGPGFRDNDIKYIRSLSRLEQLHLESTQIGDASIPVLAKLSRLKALNIGGTKITAAGLKQLQRSLPETQILHY